MHLCKLKQVNPRSRCDADLRIRSATQCGGMVMVNPSCTQGRNIKVCLCVVLRVVCLPLKGNLVVLFTALHGMQTRSSDENSVRPSVRPSVTRVYCDKTVERSVQIYILYERTFSLVFWEKEWLVGATPST